MYIWKEKYENKIKKKNTHILIVQSKVLFQTNKQSPTFEQHNPKGFQKQHKHIAGI